MRVSCIFVTVAMILAEQSNALPILGLPLLGNEGHLVGTLTNTLDRAPVTGGLTHKVVDNTQMGGGHELLNTHIALGQITSSLRRRQGIPLVQTVGSVVNGLEGLPVLGNVGSIAPVTQGLTSNVDSVNGALPDIKKVTAGTTQVLPASPLRGFFKRDMGLGSLPMVGSLPMIGSLPIMGSLPMVGSLPGLGSLPSMDSIPFAGSMGSGGIPGVSSLGLSKRDTSLPLVGSLPLAGSLPGLGSLPSMPSLPHMPSISSIPVIGGLAAGGLPGMSSLPSMSSIPLIGNVASGGFPGMSSLGL